MPKRPANKMNQADRAKQFMPFAALRGFEEELRKQEKVLVERIELSEERRAELDQSFALLRKRDMVRVVYYHQGEYISMEGLVSKIEFTSRFLTVVSTKIAFDDLYDLEILSAFLQP